MTGSTKRVGSFAKDRLSAFLDSGRMFISSKEVLILDGITFHDFFREIAVSSATWWETDKKNRRLINVFLTSAHGIYKPVEIMREGNVDFLQVSWTLEYKSAVKIRDFMKSVDKFLDADPEPGDDVDATVKSKYFFSGGCARSMFQFSTSEVKRLINESIDSLSDKSRIPHAEIGCNSEHASYNLLNVFRTTKPS